MAGETLSANDLRADEGPLPPREFTLPDGSTAVLVRNNKRAPRYQQGEVVVFDADGSEFAHGIKLDTLLTFPGVKVVANG